jgi:hypothetical protein
MTSAINPNNIDGTYPVAGQDNNSQGFRDNFTNIKTNFQYAEDEITDLQTNAVVKNADNNLNGSGLSNAVLNDMGYKRLTLGTTGGSVTINYADGIYQTMTTNATTQLAFTNFPPAGVAGEVYFQITVASVAHTLTLPVAVSVGLTGVQGISGQVITFGATGTYNFRFTTNDGGTTVTVYDLNRPLNYYTNALTVAATTSSTSTTTGALVVGGGAGIAGNINIGGIVVTSGAEDLANAGAASLTLPVSYFSTAAAETATLAAGTNGQIKTFAMYADSGDMVITVTNPGWGGSGTITFSAVGQACTLQYINSKWFCIGNNGATFA